MDDKITARPMGLRTAVILGVGTLALVCASGVYTYLLIISLW